MARWGSCCHAQVGLLRWRGVSSYCGVDGLLLGGGKGGGKPAQRDGLALLLDDRGQRQRLVFLFGNRVQRRRRQVSDPGLLWPLSGVRMRGAARGKETDYEANCISTSMQAKLVSNYSYLPRDTGSPCRSDRKWAISPSHLSAGSPA